MVDGPRVVVISNRSKPQVLAALREFLPWLQARCAEVTLSDSYDDAPITTGAADFALVLGGDGTMLGQARRVVDSGMPVVGVNFGKLGFIAPFTLDDVKIHWEALASGRAPISPRVMLETQVPRDGGEPFRSLAMNDVVVTAGPPFRMIELELTIERPGTMAHATVFAGDGVIVSTATGSTAYTLAAGGPIIAPDVDALVITPICPHTLSFRPIVVTTRDRITLKVHRANTGTTAVVDGQISAPLHTGAQLTVAAHPARLNVVTNPAVGYWETLAMKMQWAARPKFQ